MSVEKLVQAVGRATFIGSDVLRRNGFEAVTYLGQRQDFQTAIAYPHLLRAIQNALAKGIDPVALLLGEHTLSSEVHRCFSMSVHGFEGADSAETSCQLGSIDGCMRTVTFARCGRFPWISNILPDGQSRLVGNPDFAFDISPSVFETAPLNARHTACKDRPMEHEGSSDLDGSAIDEGDASKPGGDWVEGVTRADDERITQLLAALRRLAATRVRCGQAPLDAKECSAAAWRERGARRPQDKYLSPREITAALCDMLNEENTGIGFRGWTQEDVTAQLQMLYKKGDIPRIQTGSGLCYLIGALADGNCKRDSNASDSQAVQSMDPSLVSEERTIVEQQISALAARTTRHGKNDEVRIDIEPVTPSQIAMQNRAARVAREELDEHVPSSRTSTPLSDVPDTSWTSCAPKPIEKVLSLARPGVQAATMGNESPSMASRPEAMVDLTSEDRFQDRCALPITGTSKFLIS
jgi:hypothetical protein